jgi:hypothetical protein
LDGGGATPAQQFSPTIAPKMRSMTEGPDLLRNAPVALLDV